MYHWFVNPGEETGSKSPQLEIHPELFDSHMSWLKRNGYHTISLRELYDHADKGTPLARKPVVVTFDDGTRDFARHAWSSLKRHGLSATLFVVSGEVGGTNRWDQALGEPVRELLDWDELRSMQREGLEIGSHTVSHPDLQSLDKHRATRELQDSKSVLEEKLQQPIDFLAYPFGRFKDETMKIAEEVGYRGACAVLLKHTDLLKSRRYSLRRMTIKREDRGLRFAVRFRVGRLRHRISRAEPRHDFPVDSQKVES